MTEEKPDDLEVHKFTDPLPTSDVPVKGPTDGKQKENPSLLLCKSVGSQVAAKVAPLPNDSEDEDVIMTDKGSQPVATSADGELIGVEKSTPSKAGLQKEPSESSAVNGNDERAPIKPKDADVSTGALNSPAATVPNMSSYQRPGDDNDDDDDDNIPDGNEDEKGESKNASSDKGITSKGG